MLKFIRKLYHILVCTTERISHVSLCIELAHENHIIKVKIEFKPCVCLLGSHNMLEMYEGKSDFEHSFVKANIASS